jgi:hypothetical protein
VPLNASYLSVVQSNIKSYCVRNEILFITCSSLLFAVQLNTRHSAAARLRNDSFKAVPDFFQFMHPQLCLQANALATWRMWHLQRTTALLTTVAYRMQHRAQQRTTATVLRAWRSAVECDKLRALALRKCSVFKQKAVCAAAFSTWRSKVHEQLCRPAFFTVYAFI